MADQQHRPSNQNAQQDSQETFRKVQNMKRTWERSDRPDRVVNALTEYAEDSTYREADESKAAGKINRAVNMASLLSADNHLISGAEAFDALSPELQTQILDEYQQSAQAILDAEMKPFLDKMRDSSGARVSGLKHYSEVISTEELYEQGFVRYDRPLLKEEKEALNNWLSAKENGTLSSDPKASQVLVEFNRRYEYNFDLTSMDIASAQVKALLSSPSNEFTATYRISQEASDAAESLVTFDRNNLRVEDKTRIIDTARSRELARLRDENDTVRRFMQERPNATKVEWEKAIKDSQKRIDRGEAPREASRPWNKATGSTKDSPSKDTLSGASPNTGKNDSSITEPTSSVQGDSSATPDSPSPDTSQVSRTPNGVSTDAAAKTGSNVTPDTKGFSKSGKTHGGIDTSEFTFVTSDDFLDQEAIDSLNDIFATFGDITESTGFYRSDAALQSLSFFLGDMAPVINTGTMIAKSGSRVYDAFYAKWLEKSKNEATKSYRESMQKAREGLRSGDARTKYEAKQRIKDVRHKNAWEKDQLRKYGKDRNVWEQYSGRKHKSYEKTIKGKFLSKLNNSKLGGLLGKLFGFKKALAGVFMKAGVYVVGAVGSFIVNYILTVIQVIPVVMPGLYIAFAVMGIFSFSKPEFAQNCINNLNILDKQYHLAVTNEILNDFKDPESDSFTHSKYESPKYDTKIRFDADTIVVYQDPSGKILESPNNILPIFAAFKYRTGADINKASYVAAASYGKIMYWRTHFASDDYNNVDFFYDDCLDKGLPNDYYYNHCPAGYETNQDPSDSKSWCDHTTHYIDYWSGLTCTIPEHTHEVIQYPDGSFHPNSCAGIACGKEEHTCSEGTCYWSVCNEHVLSSDCYGYVCDCHPVSSDCFEKDDNGQIIYGDTGVNYICNQHHSHSPNCWQYICDTPINSHHHHTPDCYEYSSSCPGAHTHNPNWVSEGGCVDYVCGLTPHTHDDTISIQTHTDEKGSYHTYSSPCYDVYVNCLNHCPGHMTAQRTVLCLMDFEDIVKQDDLVFTENALTLGENIMQITGTIEENTKAWWNSINWFWEDAEDRFNLAEFRQKFIEQNSYGNGRNQAALFTATNNDDNAIFYHNYHLYNRLINDTSMYGTKYQELSHIPSGPYRDSYDNTKFNFTSGKGSTYNPYATFTSFSTPLYNKRRETNKNIPWYNDMIAAYDAEALSPLYVWNDYHTGDNDTYITLEENALRKTGVADTTLASDFLSPFIYDSFTYDEVSPIFKNGWGFYNERNEWLWCVDINQINTIMGTYKTGYQDAVNHFFEESGLYFNNAAPNIDLSRLSDYDASELMPSWTVTAIETVNNALNELRPYSEFYCNTYGVRPESTPYDKEWSIQKLVYLITRAPFNSGNWTNGVSLHQGTTHLLLAKRNLWLSEEVDASWDLAETHYTYVYVIGLAEKAGNHSAGENYYYCLLFDKTSHQRFRYVTLSSTELELFEQSYNVK